MTRSTHSAHEGVELRVESVGPALSVSQPAFYGAGCTHASRLVKRPLRAAWRLPAGDTTWEPEEAVWGESWETHRACSAADVGVHTLRGRSLITEPAGLTLRSLMRGLVDLALRRPYCAVTRSR